MKPKVKKLEQKQTNDQRSQAIALIKSFPASDKEKKLTVQLGSSHFQIIIEKKTLALTQDIV